MGVAPGIRQWQEKLPRRVAQTLAEARPTNVVVPVPGGPPELVQLLSAAERVFEVWGYRLDRTEQPYDSTRGVHVYAVFVRPGNGEERPTMGWLA